MHFFLAMFTYSIQQSITHSNAYQIITYFFLKKITIRQNQLVLNVYVMHFLSVITFPSMKDKNIDLDIKKHEKTSREPGNIEVNYSSKEQEECKDKHLQDMIVGTLSTEAGNIKVQY